MSPGTLFGVGLGPGDPELVTVKAARLIAAADVVAYHSARHGRSVARSIAERYLRGGQIEEALIYPVTIETPDQSPGYRAVIDEFYTDCAARLAAHLDAGRNVVVLSEGDPFFYGSYMHMHKRLADRYPTEVVPGVTSVSAAAAALGRPLVERDEVLSILPGTLPPDELARKLADTDAAAVVKLGRTFPTLRQAFERAGLLDAGWYLERVSSDRQREQPLSEVDPRSVPYFAVALLPGPLNRKGPWAPNATTRRSKRPGEVVVVGLGPAGREWLTPEAQAALAEADDLVGYQPYLNRVPANARQRRHGSDNRVERERATFALDLAKNGARVAVVSSGDPGVFAMATAVTEVAIEAGYTEIPVRVLPGVTAAQAVASRVGAPLGHDYCVLSLSDRLKPWDVIVRRLTAVAEADLAIAIYNPASRQRTWQVGAARDLLLRYRSPGTPVVIGRDVGGTDEEVTVVRLADLEPAAVDMRCLLLVGSSTTQWAERNTGRSQVAQLAQAVFTPRRYPSDVRTAKPAL